MQAKRGALCALLEHSRWFWSGPLLKFTIFESYVLFLYPLDYKSYSSLYLWKCLAYTKSSINKTSSKLITTCSGSNEVRNTVYKITLISNLDLPTKWYHTPPPQKKVCLNHIWRIEIVKNISYRHGIARILPIHKLDFHCYISGRTLTVGKIKTLRVYVEKVSVKAIVYMIVNISENTMYHYYTLQKKQMNKY